MWWSSSFYRVAIVLVLVALLPALALGQPMQRKIVVFRSEINDAGQQEAVVHGMGCGGLKHLPLINAVVAEFPAGTVSAQARPFQVAYVEDDLPVQALGLVSPQAVQQVQPAQAIPWGVKYILSRRAWPTDTGAGVRVCTLDTGIDLTHPDLQANIYGGYNTITPGASYADDNGHGTHVAGIIAACDNSIGVIGVAPGANLYAVKVLDSSGSGYTSDIIEGLNWAVANNMQIVNMSLGLSADLQSFHDAVTAAYQAGVVLIAAAGNNDGPTLYPAAYPEVVSVAATDMYGNRVSFSNFGKVELSAPGVAIRSTILTGYYGRMSGTSMASPHVAGVAALVLARHPGYTPDQVVADMQSTATHIDVATYTGAGEVNAFLASR
jgi:subtilisin